MTQSKIQVRIGKKAGIMDSRWHLFIDDVSIFASDNIELVNQYGLSHFMIQEAIIIDLLPEEDKE